MMVDFDFHGSTASHKGIFVEKFVSIPTGKERYTEYAVPGRDGSLLCKEGTYEDIVIAVQLMYLEKPHNIREKYRETKEWLMRGGGGCLKFSDQTDFHYVVKRVEIESNEIEASILGRFTVSFICKPHQYLDNGDIPIDFQNLLYNPYDEAHPLYAIQGEGECTLTVNGETVKANIGQNLTIDTELMIAYRMDGRMMNTSISGEYTSLYLRHGNNNLSVTRGFAVRITPRWRSL